MKLKIAQKYLEEKKQLERNGPTSAALVLPSLGRKNHRKCPRSDGEWRSSFRSSRKSKKL